MHKPRKEMIAETRAKLIAAARHAFGTVGYAEASMDDFTASAGLTRGALYHHFGDKKGLLQAVIAEIDGEMALRVNEVASKARTRWQHFVDECTTYIEMALEPEIQRIMFRDGPAVLGDPAHWQNANACVASMTDHLTALQEDGVVVADLDPETAARLINGASSQAAQRIANSKDPEATSKKAIAAFKQLLEGLRRKP
ncbi:TetR/AcrR family transcriptional regulator [Mesorhizobium sp.]|uniref:TetR/AcrR family transcriptional regulator n=1 Tax=Mesorhizobium sp. TaxID=1871066 RepID=UPI000FE3100D|nr:TetR/AcrR family transcriptional regulator [Mesorhizobium sp.]RWH70228.1 MAG: TetR/AcrR family transcriptional regulator [Mesorhizobium sp.]RWL23608.1 MAG: TetR/AcrR family transcriptional regulator [Mesorhizobium sp.]RWL25778.1 MAG: TetR/AcrR family transcriptional regulator [Mesorhizobium sp.]RWL34766.1 MAG: TetR/AcrR family transcriptional regulator [Mesorhizobium sp.]RWL46991.1 MAG: TetR/AcrR family transcriptional regulator [Mesorhizobium sp.]